MVLFHHTLVKGGERGRDPKGIKKSLVLVKERKKVTVRGWGESLVTLNGTKSFQGFMKDPS